MVLTVNCPVCGGAAEVLFCVTDRNRRLSTVQFRYDRCSECRVIFLQNPPDDLEEFYRDDYYRTPSLVELSRAAERESYQVGHVRRHVTGGRLVEIGAAWGVFAKQARDAGFDVLCIEMDPRSCRFVEAQLGVRVVESNEPQTVLQHLQPSEVVVLWQVLEHLPDPVATLQAAIDNLAEGGVLVLATPNPESLGFRIMGPRWPHVDAPRHLWLFPMDTVSGWLEARGMRIEEVITDDLGAKRWNRFAWQRLLANLVRQRWLERLSLVVGAGIAWILGPVESRRRNGSSYTLVARKVSS